ncbi:MAG: FAD-binding oxidoreductase [Proteobacteria bacterium]|nr:FAD-binding oxidoreductase [Pseudomonadota bacterium]
MRRRTFCKTTLAAAVAATIPGCGKELPPAATDVGSLIPAVSSAGAEISIESAAIGELAGSLSGNLYLQGDDGYDAAKRVWNGMFDHKQPAMVVQCMSTYDVVHAVDFARDRNLLVSVKGGGHSFPGKCTSDGGMMIDLSQMYAVDVDVDAKTARVDGGALLAHLDSAALQHNLLTTTGVVSHTGVGGFTLGGGMGRTDRMMGLAIDNLLAATVVTASGDVVRASEDENADLFWGLRGGGGNFGIVTEFVYRLHPFNPTVYGGDLIYDIDRDFLEFYAELLATAPDEANIEPGFGPGEDGNMIAIVGVTWAGDHAAGEKALAPMLAFPGLKSGELGPKSYQAIQTQWDGLAAHGAQNYLKSGFLNEITAEVIEIMVEFANRGETVSWFQHLGGATSRVAPDATAFAHRNVAVNFGIEYSSQDPAQNEAGIAAVREFYYALEPHMAGFYTNLNDDTEKKTWGNYGPNYPRLVELKNQYDPTNLFRLNANIRPTV